MPYNPEIFKAYDIRGVYGRDFDLGFAFELGNKLGQLFKAKKLVIGEDVRTSSPVLKTELIHGALQAGFELIDIGLATTPLFYYSVNRLKADGGIMITASHNPAEYNGFKVVKEEAIATEGTELKTIFEASALVKNGQGVVSQADLTDEYVERMLELVALPAQVKTKVVIDAAGGAAGPIIKKLLSRINLPGQAIFIDPDGSFSQHPPNPLELDAQKHARIALAQTQADFAVMFDGDADRVIFMTADGKLVDSDYILLLLSQNITKPTIVYDLRMSHSLVENINKWGGQAIKSRVGHTFIKQLMRKHQADLGGELSGHFPVKDDSWHYSEASILVFLKILKIVEEKQQTLAQLIKPFQKYARSGEINFEIKDKQSVMKHLEDKYSSGLISHLDGITIEFNDWWFNVRPSNTEPLLRLVVETNSQLLLEEKVSEISSIFL